MAGLPAVHDTSILVQQDTMDDAGVIRISDELALIQTVDFFTPVVDDAETYGQIAAANSLSDVYAMGGTPISALNIMCWDESLPDEILHQILKGGMEKAIEADCPIVGGHSVSAPELKYGLSITGRVHPDRVVTNAGARPGDVLILTKPVGTGIITTALKAGKAGDDHLKIVVESMTRLNANASAAMQEVGVSGATDITGNGLIGHAWELAQSSGVQLEIVSGEVPLFEGTVELAKKKNLTKGDKTNRDYVGDDVTIDSGVESPLQSALFDPQTSGGMLISVSPEKSQALSDLLTDGDDLAVVIGSVVDGSHGTVRIVS